MDDVRPDQNPQPSAPPAGRTAELEAELEKTRRERDEYLAGWKRAQADYQNLRKEVEREKSEFVKYANERLLTELIPAADQFALAMRHQPDPASLDEEARKPWDNWLVGLRAVYSCWERAASAVGLERIPTDGSFDPALHEAVGQEPVEGMQPGMIIRVLEDGWRLNGKILRPTKVIVSS